MSPQSSIVSPAERLRLRAGLRQDEAAERAGIDVRTLRYAELGREPSFPVVRKLADLYDVDPGDLLEQIRQHRAELAA